MTRVRATDTSALPAAKRESDGHTHPMPLWARVLFVLVPLLFLITLTLTYIAVQWEARQRDVAILRELDRRTAERDAEAKDTRDALCRVLTIDLAGSRNAADLARQFDCL